jgi:hypothetical protein
MRDLLRSYDPGAAPGAARGVARRADRNPRRCNASVRPA